MTHSLLAYSVQVVVMTDMAFVIQSEGFAWSKRAMFGFRSHGDGSQKFNDKKAYFKRNPGEFQQQLYPRIYITHEASSLC